MRCYKSQSVGLANAIRGKGGNVVHILEKKKRDRILTYQISPLCICKLINLVRCNCVYANASIQSLRVSKSDHRWFNTGPTDCTPVRAHTTDTYIHVNAYVHQRRRCRQRRRRPPPTMRPQRRPPPTMPPQSSSGTTIESATALDT